jgi:hypothetical protein
MTNPRRVIEAICAIREWPDGHQCFTKLGVDDLIFASQPARPSGLIDVIVRGEIFTVLLRDLVQNTRICTEARDLFTH